MEKSLFSEHFYTRVPFLHVGTLRNWDARNDYLFTKEHH